MNEFNEEKEQEESAEYPETVELSDTDESGSEKENVPSETEKKKKSFGEAVGWANSIVFAAAAMLVVNLFLFRSITVSGPSMCDTLQNKDRVLVTNLFYEPAAGDIVVLQADKLINGATNLYGETIIKRVIGVAGDRIMIDYEKGEVYRNGELLREDYIKELTTKRYSGWVESGEECVVPENCVFVMGDNRNISHDSRDLEIVGYIDKNLILGKAFVRFFPFSEIKWL